MAQATESNFSDSLTVNEFRRRFNLGDIQVLKNEGKNPFWTAYTDGNKKVNGPVSSKYDSTKPAQFAITHEGVAILCNQGTGGADLVQVL